MLDGPSRTEGAVRLAAFHEVAAGRGVSPQRVALARLLGRSPTVLPIPGASRPETIRDSAAATDLVLSEEERTHLDAAAVGP